MTTSASHSTTPTTDPQLSKTDGELPRPAAELDDLARCYDTHDTSSEMEPGHWVDPRPMRTTSLRLPADLIDELKERAQEQGLRYTALVRIIIENALRDSTPETTELAKINDRLARIEDALTRHPQSD